MESCFQENGDALASVDLRYERLLRSDLSKQDVAIEIPRKPDVSQSQKLKKAKATALKPHLPLAGPVYPRRVVIGIVVDAKPRYLAQAQLWLKSLRSLAHWKMGDANSGPTILACVLPGVPQWLKSQFARAGVIIREILPLSEMLPGATPHSNKLVYSSNQNAEAKALRKLKFVSTWIQTHCF